MSAVEVFRFPTTGQEIRTIIRDGETWFLAADITSVLDLGNPRSSLALLDEDEKAVHTMDTLGGAQNVTVVNEPGLYSLTLRSRKPEAKQFKRWITHEVIPAIRKTGGYSLVSATAAPDLTSAEAVLALAEAYVVSARKLVAAEERIAIDAPKVAQAEHYRSADMLIAIGSFANDLVDWAWINHKITIRHKEVRDFMADLHLLIRGNTIRNNQPTADAVKRGLLRTHHSTYQTNSHGLRGADSARLTTKGRDYVWDRAVARIAEHGSLVTPRLALPGPRQPLDN